MTIFENEFILSETNYSNSVCDGPFFTWHLTKKYADDAYNISIKSRSYGTYKNNKIVGIQDCWDPETNKLTRFTYGDNGKLIEILHPDGK